MHSYDVHGRQGVYLVIGLLSVPPVWLVAFTLEVSRLEPEWWMTTPSFGAFYFVLHWLFVID